MNILEMNTDHLSKEDLIEYKKKINDLIKEARKSARHNECILCGSNSGFCDSHTIPQFCLRNIAWNGKLNSFNTLIDTDILTKDSGINNAGIFHTICKKCDGTVFQDYENPQAYENEITHKMLNQMVLKNELRDIYKHETEIEMYNSSKQIMLKKIESPYSLFYEKMIDAQIMARKIDLEECYDLFEKAKENMNSDNEWLKILSYDVLEYVTPVAFQGKIAIITGAKKEVINNIYSYRKNYKMEYLQLIILPLKDKTVIITFTDASYKRYQKFEKYIKTLSQEERLNVINKILFWYAEDYYLSKHLKDDVLQLMQEVAKTTQDISTIHPVKSFINAMKYFDLRRDVDFPNLLSKEYAVQTTIQEN